MKVRNGKFYRALLLLTAVLFAAVASTMQAQTPVITSATGTTTTYGTTFVVDVQGTSFISGATILVGGTAATTNAVTTSDLQTTVTNPSNTTYVVSVAVQNPGGSTSTSQNVTLTVPAAPTTQQQWMTDISQQNQSTAYFASGDSQLSWTAPDGRTGNVLVKAPAPVAGAPTVTVATVPAGADARPYFDTALSQAISTQAGLVLVPNGTYTFKSLGTGNYGQLQIIGQKDLVINGQGSTFIFTLNDAGVLIQSSQRVLLENCIIQYVLPTQNYWIGTMSSSTPYTLTPISGYTVTSSDTIGHMAQYNSSTDSFVHPNHAIYLPASLTFTGSGFTSTSFTSGYAGETFMVFEHYYGGVAVSIEAYNPANQSQDISLNNVTINSGPGMGIGAYGISRGFGVWNSHIMPATGSLISTEYDAINVETLNGDTYIHDNVIGYEGDDAFNIHSFVMPIVSYSGTSLTMSTYSTYIKKYDLLSFFDTSNNFLGTAQVTAAPVYLGSGEYSFTLGNAVSGVTTSSVVRDMNEPSSRAAFVNNTVENCQCHGSLIQTPNVLVQNNKYTDPLDGAINLLTNVGSFLEGTGAINVLVQFNTIDTTGVDKNVPSDSTIYGGIFVYGQTLSGFASVVSNEYINIANNTISNTDQDCIVVASSQYVNVTSNQCKSDNLTSDGSPSIYILDANTVTISGNSRSGTDTGPIYVDPSTTSGITVQTTY